MRAQIKPVLCALQAHKMSSGEEQRRTELMSVAYEVGGSVAPGLKGHIPLSEHNGRGKSPSLTDTQSRETRPTARCLFTTECASK